MNSLVVVIRGYMEKKVERMKESKFNYFLLLVAGVVILSIYFIAAASNNLASSTANGSSTISMLWFNVSNTSAGVGGNTLTSVTINQAVGGSNSNVTNVTIFNSTNVYYNGSFSSFPVVINIGNITGNTNFTVNFTISSSAKDAATIQANVTAFVNESNITFTALPYNSTIVTIDSLVPYIQYGPGATNHSNISQGYIYVNISANDTVSNLRSLIIYLLNSTGEVNRSTNSSIGATTFTHSINFTSLSDGTYYVNATVNDSFNHINISATRTIVLDTVAPTVNLPNYTNGTSKKNTQSLTLNISISDATSGLAGGICIFDVNGTNQTLAISSGWCNSTSIALTGLSDGNRTINVFVNDSANNVKLNNSFVVQVDTTNPSASAGCTPSSVNTGDTVTCTCSGTDATSGVASSTATSTPSTSQTGTFSYSCTVTDNAGNSAGTSAQYTVTQSPGGGGSSGGGGSTTFWSGGTFSISSEQIADGHSAQISVKQRAKMQISGEDHYVGVREIISTTARIEVSSTPQEKTIAVGEEWKVEVTGDKYYDLNVKLNSIENNKANVFMMSIHELMPVIEEPVEEEIIQQEETPPINGDVIDEGEGGSLGWLWVIIILAVIFIIWFIIYKNKKLVSKY